MNHLNNSSNNNLKLLMLTLIIQVFEAKGHLLLVRKLEVQFLKIVQGINKVSEIPFFAPNFHQTFLILGNFQYRHFPSSSSSVSLSESSTTSSGIKRRKSEEVTGKQNPDVQKVTFSSIFTRKFFLGATFKFKDSIRERFGKEFEQDRTSSMETPQRRSVESYGLTATSNPTMLESGSSRKRAGRSSSEHFEDTKNSLHYHNHPSSKDYKLNHSHHHQQQLQTHEYKTEKKVIF